MSSLSLQGALWGIVLLSSELDVERNQVSETYFLDLSFRRLISSLFHCLHAQMWLRIGAGSVACTLYGYSLYYLAIQLDPTKANFDLWAQNDDWGR